MVTRFVLYLDIGSPPVKMPVSAVTNSPLQISSSAPVRLAAPVLAVSSMSDSPSMAGCTASIKPLTSLPIVVRIPPSSMPSTPLMNFPMPSPISPSTSPPETRKSSRSGHAFCSAPNATIIAPRPAITIARFATPIPACAGLSFPRMLMAPASESRMAEMDPAKPIMDRVSTPLMDSNTSANKYRLPTSAPSRIMLLTSTRMLPSTFMQMVSAAIIAPSAMLPCINLDFSIPPSFPRVAASRAMAMAKGIMPFACPDCRLAIFRHAANANMIPTNTPTAGSMVLISIPSSRFSVSTRIAVAAANPTAPFMSPVCFPAIRKASPNATTTPVRTITRPSNPSGLIHSSSFRAAAIARIPIPSIIMLLAPVPISPILNLFSSPMTVASSPIIPAVISSVSAAGFNFSLSIVDTKYNAPATISSAPAICSTVFPIGVLALDSFRWARSSAKAPFMMVMMLPSSFTIPATASPAGIYQYLPIRAQMSMLANQLWTDSRIPLSLSFAVAQAHSIASPTESKEESFSLNLLIKSLMGWKAFPSHPPTVLNTVLILAQTLCSFSPSASKLGSFRFIPVMNSINRSFSCTSPALAFWMNSDCPMASKPLRIASQPLANIPPRVSKLGSLTLMRDTKSRKAVFSLPSPACTFRRNSDPTMRLHTC